MKQYLCPCCEAPVFEEKGKYEICPFCGWEDDPSQSEFPELSGGANEMNLKTARINFCRYGTCNEPQNEYYENPILYADYSDPDAIRVGEDYFMIASSFSNAPGLPLLHSKDLVHWKVVNYILPEIPEGRYDKPIHGCGVWAPAIRYHEGTYFACFPMPDEGIYMSTATDPFGEWSKAVNIRPGAGWIDPCPFWDEDGRAYLVAGVAKSRIGYKSVLHMVEMQPDGMGLIGEEVKIFDGNENDQLTIEGPKMYKKNGWYYIFAPAGGVKTGWQTVLRSKNVFGPYEYRIVMRQGETKINGPHQGAWVDTVTGEDWFLHFQDVYAAGRIVHLQPMTWEDEWPIIGEKRKGTTYGEPVMRYRKPNVGKVAWNKCTPATSDDFLTTKLGMQWQWNANPKAGWYELNGEGIQLNAVNVDADVPYGDVPSILMQKWPAPEFECVTKFRLWGMKDGDITGIMSLGTTYGLLEIRREGTDYVLSFVKGKQHFANSVCDSTEENSYEIVRLEEEKTPHLYIKYEVECVGKRNLNSRELGFPLEIICISYSTDGIDYAMAGQFESVPGRWVGVKNGPFCIRRDDNQGGCVIVEYVAYE